jgi:hypothetical protein
MLRSRDAPPQGLNRILSPLRRYLVGRVAPESC